MDDDPTQQFDPVARDHPAPASKSGKAKQDKTNLKIPAHPQEPVRAPDEESAERQVKISKFRI